MEPIIDEFNIRDINSINTIGITLAFLGGGSMLPRDPVMLLSYVNTQLRDRDASLDALCDREETDRDALCAALREIGYEYDAAQNRFV